MKNIKKILLPILFLIKGILLINWDDYKAKKIVYLNNKKISSIKGIEALTILTTLDLSNNEIISIKELVNLTQLNWILTILAWLKMTLFLI
jgi:Leucine-rich repeat (LRR) protein